MNRISIHETYLFIDAFSRSVIASFHRISFCIYLKEEKKKKIHHACSSHENALRDRINKIITWLVVKLKG